jgi:hypothetical protein
MPIYQANNSSHNTIRVVTKTQFMFWLTVQSGICRYYLRANCSAGLIINGRLYCDNCLTLYQVIVERQRGNVEVGEHVEQKIYFYVLYTPKSKTSISGHSGTSLPLHDTMVLSRAFSIRFKSFILRRTDVRCSFAN